MTDIADLAENRIDAEREKLGALLRARVAPSGVTECEDCGETIPPARLAAAPFATRCIFCQTKFEQGR